MTKAWPAEKCGKWSYAKSDPQSGRIFGIRGKSADLPWTLYIVRTLTNNSYNISWKRMPQLPHDKYNCRFRQQKPLKITLLQLFQWKKRICRLTRGRRVCHFVYFFSTPEGWAWLNRWVTGERLMNLTTVSVRWHQPVNKTTQPYRPDWLGLRQCAFTCVGWQVTLCDPIWQVMPRSSEMGSHEEPYAPLTYLYRHNSCPCYT